VSHMPQFTCPLEFVAVMASGGVGMSITSGRKTFWHVTEMSDSLNPTQSHSYTIPNATPHALRWITEPHLGTYRVVNAQRRHANSGASSLRLVLESRDKPDQHIILHSVLVSLTWPGQGRHSSRPPAAFPE
jgi:hypothetical protein